MHHFFNFNLPFKFAKDWFLQRLFKKPKSIPIPAAPTSDFCVALFIYKIEAKIGNIGDMIGCQWESDNLNAILGPVAAAEKQSLLQLILHIIPLDDGGRRWERSLSSCSWARRFQHSQYVDYKECERFTACDVCVRLGNGCIVPAILSDPFMQWKSTWWQTSDATPTDLESYTVWAEQYFTVRTCPNLFRK